MSHFGFKSCCTYCVIKVKQREQEKQNIWQFLTDTPLLGSCVKNTFFLLLKPHFYWAVQFGLVQYGTQLFCFSTFKRVLNNRTVPYLFWSPFRWGTKWSKRVPRGGSYTPGSPMTASRQETVFKCSCRTVMRSHSSRWDLLVCSLQQPSSSCCHSGEKVNRWTSDLCRD